MSAYVDDVHKYGTADLEVKFDLDYFIVQNNPFFELDSKKFFNSERILNTSTGEMTWSIDFPFHDQSFVHNYRIDLLSNNFPLESDDIFKDLRNIILNFFIILIQI